MKTTPWLCFLSKLIKTFMQKLQNGCSPEPDLDLLTELTASIYQQTAVLLIIGGNYTETWSFCKRHQEMYQIITLMNSVHF